MYGKFSCFVIGEGTLPVLCAQELIKASSEILGIISPDPAVLRWAQANSVPGFSTAAIEVLRQTPYDYLFSIANRVILREEILSTPRQYAINFHDAPLPKYAGVHATSWALMQREREHGITWHTMVADKIDGGEILKQVIIPVSPTETTLSLNSKCFGAGVKAFAEMIRELGTDQVSRKQQDFNQRSYFPSSRKPTGAGILSWQMSGQDMEALVRALDFGSYANTLSSAKLIVEDSWLVVDKLQALSSKSNAAAGTIIGIRDNALIVATSSCDVMIRQLRTIDGEKLSAPDFATRFKLSPGYRFDDIRPDQRNRIAVLAESLARYENAWRRRLSDPKPLAISSARSDDAAGGTGIACHQGILRSSEIKEFLKAHDTWSVNDFLFAAYVIYLSCLSGEGDFCVGFGHLKLRDEIRGLESFFAYPVPLVLDVNGNKKVMEAIDDIIGRLESTKASRTYLRDLGSRYQGVSPTRLSIVIEEAGVAEASKADFDLKFTASESGNDCCWFYDSRLLSRRDVETIHDNFCNFLSALMVKAADSVNELPTPSHRRWLGAGPVANNPEILETTELSEGEDRRRRHQNPDKTEQRAILLDLKEKRISPAEARQKLESILRKSSARGSGSSKIDVRSGTVRNQVPEPVAVVGVSGRFPGAKNIQEFWENLKNGVDSVKEITKDRWDIDRYFDPEPGKAGKIYSRYAGFIDDIERFDPSFFNISPKEAEQMEPQYRLLLQETWRAIEDAGYKASSLSGKKVGIFVGASVGDYSGDNVQVPSLECSRIAYLFDWRGPCICIETACSSALVALHEACMYIGTNQVEMAVVGGMNLMVTPNAYRYLSRTYALSAKGKCFSFDSRADGTIFSEGVCAIVLKPLSSALSDNDHIYGVIKGSGINYDGKTNGITAPSGKAQMELEAGIYRQFNIDPETITMVEAHGTGTTLGDPIEADALNKAFRKFTQKKSFCALGSVKSNIGHTGFASGLVGVIKTLLSLEYRQIPATINYQDLNPAISFADSPFYINTALKDWAALEPRVAAISSFGFSGTNAHVVVEEGPARRPPNAQAVEVADSARMVPLSAKNRDRLWAAANNLLMHLREDKMSRAGIDLTDLAYTLQVGREEMNSRVVFLVHSLDELIDNLAAFVDADDDSQRGERGKWCQGDVKKSADGLRLVKGDKHWRDQVRRWAQQGRLVKLAELWAKGVDVDWALLYPDLADRTGNPPNDRRGPYRISLPTYPFAEERYWIDKDTLGRSAVEAPALVSDLPLPGLLHPLLHANTSDLSEQRFTSRFSGEEPFLKDHRVKGQKVLPGVAYLEMALAAVQRACGGESSAKAAADGGVRLDSIRLTNVVWARPISVRDKPTEVNIGLFPQEDGRIVYEIYTHHPSSAEKAVVHSQGVAVLTAADLPSPLNLVALQAGLNGNSLSPQACYAAFSAMGIDYGPAHRGLERIYVGEREVLAKLKLPACVTETKSQYSLHPSVLDSALQATIGIGNSDVSLHRLVGDRRSRPSLPFALESLEVMAACKESMWAWIRSVGNLAADTGAASEMLQKFDIDLCDEQGNICVRLRGFSSRVFKGAESESAEPIGTLLLRPIWEEKPASCTESPREYAQTHVFLCGFDRDLHGLPGDLAATSFVNLDSAGALQPPPLESSRPWYRRFEDCAVGLFEAIKEILRTQLQGEVLVQVLVPGGGRDRAFSAVSGLLKSAQLEHPRLVGQVIEVDGDESAPELIDRLRKDAQSPQDRQIRYEGGKRCVASLAAAVAPEVDNLPWRTGGVYWITGGAGGLGLIFATEIAERINSGTLILTGRSALSPERKARLAALESLGPRIVYKSVDVSDRRAVEALVNEIKSESGGLHGVVHAAGVLRDNFIVKKTGAEFREVLSPKVGGVVNVDEATKELDLDFFVVFSSGAGEMGNVGQSDYATANAFMDAFADYRNALGEVNQRTGRTLSINWPLWRDGGMRSDEATERMLREKLGMMAMQTPSGMAAFYRCLASSEPRVMVVEGMLERMNRKLLPAQRDAQTRPGAALVTPSAAVETGDLLDKVQQNLIQVICEAMKLKAQDLDVDSELSEYGFDSIAFTDLANRLNQRYGLELTPTVFFEYSSIGSFAKYLVDEHRGAVVRQFTISPQERSQEEAGESDVRADDGPRRDGGDSELEKHPGISKRRARFANAAPSLAPEVNGPQPFAIVGMSGRFPMAADLDEFWNNLRAGKDCIEEIPKQRWDWKAYFGDPLQEGNKTNIKWGGFIEGVDEFDPLFFGISHREAEIMDPQQRLLMTYIWLALEDAGYSAASLSGSRTGIFVATANNGYDSLLFRSNLAVERYSATGMAPSIGPNRMSYFLNIHGPSEPVDTACSSSLVAIHRAIAAIEADDCDQALVGGVNTLVTPDAFIRFNKEGMLSEDGRCKTFSSRANGYARGEGVGILFLKTLKAAEAAGDHIYGLIRASAENHGGRANSLTAPNPKAQAELLVRAYRKAGMDPRSVGYIEAHGTGTKLGDPIEIDALKNAFMELYRQSGDTAVAGPHCGIGSVKTNIGHLELASGVAGVIKVLLQFKHEMLVESLHCKEMNPYIDLRGGPFYVVQEAKQWEALRDDAGKTLPRRAGVSSFGFGGVNAHIVLEEYRAKPREDASANGATEASDPVVVVLSGKNRDRLRDYAKNLLQFVQNDMGPESKTSLRDLAYTLQVGRDAMDARLGVIVHSKPELAQKLEEFIEGREGTEGVYSGQVKKDKESLTVFGADEELREAVGKWIEGKKFAKVLELWVKGLNVDWNGLYGERRPQRVSAPTYPFARDRYWVEPRSASTEDGKQSDIDLRAGTPDQHIASLNSSAQPAGGGELLCFEEIWQPVTVPHDAGDRVAWTPRNVLCFLSDTDRRQSLRRYLEVKSQDTNIFFVSTAESPFAADCRVEPGSGDSFREAFQRIAGVTPDVDAMLYLWPLEDPAFIEDAAGIATILQSLNLAALHPRRIVLAGEYSDGLQRSHLESWIGFERSIGLAWPDTRLTALIREQSGGGGDRADWWPMLWRELTKAETTSVLYQGQMPCELRVCPLAEASQTEAATL